MYLCNLYVIGYSFKCVLFWCECERDCLSCCVSGWWEIDIFRIISFTYAVWNLLQWYLFVPGLYVNISIHITCGYCALQFGFIAIYSAMMVLDDGWLLCEGVVFVSVDYIHSVVVSIYTESE